MVLVRQMAVLLLAGCIKARPPVQAPSSADVASTVSLGTIDTAHGAAVPKGLTDLLREVLSARRLNLQSVAAPDDFSRRLGTDHRLRWLADHNGGAPLLLLLELSAHRYDNLGGRFRWVVEVQLSIAPQSKPAATQTTRFAVPVHLQHAHGDASDAVAASLPTLRRRLSAALDSHLSGATAP